MSLPFENQIKSVISALGFSVDRPQELAKLVKNLSDHFISQKQQPTPWHLKETQAAYLAYYLPLGYARVQAVLERSPEFFKGLTGFLDFGSGPGTAALALQSLLKNGICVELSQEAIHLHKKFSQINIKWQTEFRGKPARNTLGVFAYVLNELIHPPQCLYDFDALMILEPSTQQDFKNFSRLRTELIEKGFTIWAPCTHQGVCPLSEGRDWCHDRVDFDPPAWWEELERHLPFKNRTITFSYLLARRVAPSLAVREGYQLARIVGDRLDEKGKTRQLVCRSPKREFLSWLHKEGEPQDLMRGELVEVALEAEVKSNEIRVTKAGAASFVTVKSVDEDK